MFEESKCKQKQSKEKKQQIRKATKLYKMK